MNDLCLCTEPQATSLPGGDDLTAEAGARSEARAECDGRQREIGAAQQESDVAREGAARVSRERHVPRCAHLETSSSEESRKRMAIRTVAICVVSHGLVR